MSSGLDMSLDDLIKTNKKSGSNRTRPPSSGPGGPTRRFQNPGPNRATPYSAPEAPESAWKHDVFVDQDGPQSFGAGFGVGQPSSIESGTKLYISNLDYGVSSEDIQELFAEVGDIKRSAIHYDRSGRSKGTAEVIYSRREEAVAAVKRYNNVQLDGKPMKIDMVGMNTVTAAPQPANAGFGNPNARSGQGRGGVSGRSSVRRGGGRGSGRGRGRGRGCSENVSAEDLDADLEKYHSEAMQEN